MGGYTKATVYFPKAVEREEISSLLDELTERMIVIRGKTVSFAIDAFLVKARFSDEPRGDEKSIDPVWDDVQKAKKFLEGIEQLAEAGEHPDSLSYRRDESGEDFRIYEAPGNGSLFKTLGRFKSLSQYLSTEGYKDLCTLADSVGLAECRDGVFYIRGQSLGEVVEGQLRIYQKAHRLRIFAL